MTNDYKNNILEYITNNITPTPGENKPIFNMESDIDIDLHQTIKDKLAELEGSVSASLLNCVVEETSQLIVFYGTYKTDLTEDNCYGYIYITDKDLNEVQMITKFSSGTRIFPIRCLNQDETGQFYGLSYDDTTNTQNNNARVLLLNNIFASAINGDYQVVLRQSYLIPNRNNYDFSTGISMTSFNRQTSKIILKTPEEATYYIKCKEKTTDNACVIRFTINVGSENEWVATTLGVGFTVYDVLIEKDEDTFKYHIYSQQPFTYVEQVIQEDKATTVKAFRTDYALEEICAVSTNEIYAIATYSIDSTNVVKITNDIIPIYTVEDTNDTTMDINEEKGIVFVRERTFSGFDPYQVKVGIVFNDTVYFSSAKTWTGESLFFTDISYNLVNIYVSTDETTKFILDYNPLNYNGLEYSACNQTLATKARLYSNGEMVFARNLYDTTLLGAIATSNLQVPNTLLNGIPIVIESLVGATNGILINNSTPITKNIYETLYVNFIRSISVIDEDTDTLYPNTASYINLNINTANQQNCGDTFIGKVSINYSNSTIMQEINWTYNTDHYETSFVVDATQEVPTIDFLSNDETTVYISKELDITSGAYYLVSQKLRIE